MGAYKGLRGRSDPAFPSGDHAPVLEDQHERPPCQCSAPKVRIIFLKILILGLPYTLLYLIYLNIDLG
jgi:hypothetical protein